MDKYKFTASGQVAIYRINSANKELILTSNNAMLPLMKNAVAWLLANSVVGKIDQIKVYYLGALLATAPVITYAHPDTDQARFEALFNEASFDGNFDKLELVTSNLYGPVAEVTSFLSSKLDTEQLLVTWTLTII